MEGGGCTPQQSLYVYFLCMGSDGFGDMGSTGDYRDGLIPHSLRSASVYTLGERSRSAFGFEFLLQLDEAPA